MEMTDAVSMRYLNATLLYGGNMNEKTFKIKDDHIRLGQALKAAGLVESGVDAKYADLDGLVKVNGSVELQRGKKLFPGDCVEYQGETLKIE